MKAKRRNVANRSSKIHLLERRTPLVPKAIAEGVWQEYVVKTGRILPRTWIARLARRTRTVFIHNPRFRKLLEQLGDAGRDCLWAFMQHWLDAMIYRQQNRF